MGNRNGDGTFDNVLENANFWSATEDGANNAYGRNLNYDGTDLNTNDNNKDNAMPVRCVKDSYGLGMRNWSRVPRMFKLNVKHNAAISKR